MSIEDLEIPRVKYTVNLPYEWRAYLRRRSLETHRSPGKYVEMLLEQDRKKHEKE